MMGISFGASFAGSPWPESVMTMHGALLTATLAGTKAVDVPSLPAKTPPSDGMGLPPAGRDCRLSSMVPGCLDVALSSRVDWLGPGRKTLLGHLDRNAVEM